MYSIYILNKKGTGYVFLESYDTYTDALSRMRYSEGMLEYVINHTFYFVSESINKSKKVSEEKISYFIEDESNVEK